jgi:endothelin-converting enzyme/putative endopeptidase
MRLRFAVVLLLLSLSCWAQTQTQPKPQEPPKKPAAEQSPKPLPDQVQKPAAEAAAKAGFKLSNLDRTADPCEDFYQFACGSWMKSNPIPSDQSSWDSFTQVYVQNQGVLHDILEKAAKPVASRKPVERQIGDFYYACMDEKTANSKGINALKPELDRINAVKDKAEMMDVVAHIHLVGPNPIFGIGSRPDFHDASMTIANIDQNGLTMPDRDYYLKDDEKTTAVRNSFVAYMTNLFTLAGQSADQAKTSAQTVLNIETELAKVSMERTRRRDPRNLDHRMKVSDIAAAAPNFQFVRYFRAAGLPAFTELNVGNPDYFKQLNGVIEKYPLDAWKTYLSWQMMNFIAPWLSDPFVQANFKFQQAFTGQEEIQVRWKRCVDNTDNNLGEALGQPYVDETFGAEGKQRMLKMVAALEDALDRDIRGLEWMTPETKKQAKVKLEAIYNMIGYPDKWRDYSSVKVARDDLAGNIFRATEFESHRQLNKIGKPVDRKEWGMTPPTVNAYYSGSLNEIVFPAGILQPPFFDRSQDDAINFGAIGAVIGHELTHGFDDQGRKYDAQGNLRDWWTAADGQEFEKRASCVADEYSGFTAVDDLKLNGRLTLGENTADNGGARVALMALIKTLQEQNKMSDTKDESGFSPEQRFFLGFANVWCENRTPALSRMLVTVDPHSPGRWRTNGVVQNMPEFQKAFGCKPGQAMVRQNACHVW